MLERVAQVGARRSVVVGLAVVVALMLVAAVAAISTRPDDPRRAADTTGGSAGGDDVTLGATSDTVLGDLTDGGPSTTAAAVVLGPSAPTSTVRSTAPRGTSVTTVATASAGDGRCTGSPARQWDDPQSPPCVPRWSGDNGGATYQGVTATEVRIAVPASVMEPAGRLLATFFERQLETYGRHLVLRPFDGQPQSCDAAQALAADVYAREKPFAALGLEGGVEQCWSTSMNQRGVVVVTARTGETSGDLVQFPKLRWSYPMTVDLQVAAMGRWICDRLAGRTARFGGPDVAGRHRKFGVLTEGPSWPAETLQRCGEQAVVRQASGAPDSASAVSALRDTGVTSVICFCTSPAAATQADALAWYPEWILGSYGVGESLGDLRAWSGAQAQHLFGITATPRNLSVEATPMFRAFRAVDATFTYVPSRDGARLAGWFRLYRELLLLSSAIQLGGPKLGPNAIDNGLHGAAFPNPTDPRNAGAVGFPDTTYAMTQDVAEWWWSSRQVAPQDGGQGAICYVDGGRRHTTAAGWPAGEGALFTGACDTG
jgi:hypothetical protein